MTGARLFNGRASPTGWEVAVSQFLRDCLSTAGAIVIQTLTIDVYAWFVTNYTGITDPFVIRTRLIIGILLFLFLLDLLGHVLRSAKVWPIFSSHVRDKMAFAIGLVFFLFPLGLAAWLDLAGSWLVAPLLVLSFVVAPLVTLFIATDNLRAKVKAFRPQ